MSPAVRAALGVTAAAAVTTVISQPPGSPPPIPAAEGSDDATAPCVKASMPILTHRIGTEADIAAMRALMALAIDTLQADFLTPVQVAASRAVMGLDSQLVRDGTYFVVEEGGVLVGCGGWSRRATLYGGDHSAALRNDALLDPARDPARTRAMYTHPDHVRRGIGRLILRVCEAAAAAEGFARMELMATLSGVPLYEASGYAAIEPVTNMVGGVAVPLIRMGKRIG